MNPSSPQAKEMADESMVRNLAAQAEAIWPQEEPVFDRHPIGNGKVLDVGCGTGEILARLAAKYPEATFVGIDLEESAPAQIDRVESNDDRRCGIECDGPRSRW